MNLIGEHTDYNDGFVFPAAIDRALYVAARPCEGSSRIFSAQRLHGCEFDALDCEPGSVDGWGRYAAGMGWALRGEGQISNLEAAIYSEVPTGSGVSSSAAMEMAMGSAWNDLCGLGLEMKRLALLGQRCENDFVGVKSGIMDQMASAMGKAGHAMFLDTRTLEIEYAPIPAGAVVVLLDTGKKRALASSAYNERRAECEKASRVLGVRALRDAGEADLEGARGMLDDTTYRRARHVITENARCLAFLEALGDSDLSEVGRLMRESHESLRDDYEVSCEELDAMAEGAWQAPGCIGARMTGAGFGGSCVALVDEGLAKEFVKNALEQYRKSTGLRGAGTRCQVTLGAGRC